MKTLSEILLVLSSVILPASCFVFCCVRLRKNPSFAVGGIACYGVFGIAADRLFFGRFYMMDPAVYMISVSRPEQYLLFTSACSSVLLIAGIYIIMKNISPAQLDSFTVISFGCGFSAAQTLWRSGIGAVYMLATRQGYLYSARQLSFLAAGSLSLFAVGICVCVLISENVLRGKAVYALLSLGILELCLYPASVDPAGAYCASVMIVSAILGIMTSVYVLGKRRIL
ncbi:MAG: hypothetical protein J5822_01420 [Eubacteriaceae bacterium]|nr:hypothetical protein [Eubacteriaceae bacterium]